MTDRRLKYLPRCDFPATSGSGMGISTDQALTLKVTRPFRVESCVPILLYLSYFQAERDERQSAIFHSAVSGKRMTQSLQLYELMSKAEDISCGNVQWRMINPKTR